MSTITVGNKWWKLSMVHSLLSLKSHRRKFEAGENFYYQSFQIILKKTVKIGPLGTEYFGKKLEIYLQSKIRGKKLIRRLKLPVRHHRMLRSARFKIILKSE